MATDRVVIFPWQSGTPEYQVVVNVIQFLGQPGGDVTLVAFWSLLGRQGQACVRISVGQRCEVALEAGSRRGPRRLAARSRPEGDDGRVLVVVHFGQGVVHRIMDEHRGTVSVDSVAGRGTRPR